MTEGQASRDHAGQRASEKQINDQVTEGGPFVSAVQATRMPMVVTDPTVEDNPIIFANDAFLAMCGYPMDEVLGQNYTFLSGPDTDPEMPGRIKASIAARNDLDMEVLFYRKGGEPIWVAAFFSPIIEDNRVKQHFASFLDITQRVEAEWQLKEAHALLERRVTERTRSLKAANAKLEAEVERRTRLEAVLRDTLAQREEDVRYRTVLAQEIDHRTKNALMMASMLLQIQASRIEDPACGAALMVAMQRLTRMAEVHALLHHGENPESVDFAAYLHRLVKELGDTLQPIPGQIEVTVEVDEARFGPDLVIPLGLVVNEAMTNALKHAFPNGRKGRIGVTLQEVGEDEMRLSIEDDGVGMPASRREGALGLNLIQTFAEQIGGTSRIGPGPSRGTSVAVTFPSRRAE